MNSSGIRDGCPGEIRSARHGHEFHGVKMNRMIGLTDKLMKPHRRHVYQLLANEMGVDHWKVSVGYGVL